MKIRTMILRVKLAWWWIWDFLFTAYLDYFYNASKSELKWKYQRCKKKVMVKNAHLLEPCGVKEGHWLLSTNPRFDRIYGVFQFFKGARPNIQLDRICLENGVPVLVKTMRYVNQRERKSK